MPLIIHKNVYAFECFRLAMRWEMFCISRSWLSCLHFTFSGFPSHYRPTHINSPPDFFLTVLSSFQDSKLVIDRHKSGFPIPQDVPFEDLSVSGGSMENQNNTSKSLAPANTVKSTTVSGKSKKRGGIFGLFVSSKVNCLCQLLTLDAVMKSCFLRVKRVKLVRGPVVVAKCVGIYSI